MDNGRNTNNSLLQLSNTDKGKIDFRKLYEESTLANEKIISRGNNFNPTR
jgi:hypothetical protein